MRDLKMTYAVDYVMGGQLRTLLVRASDRDEAYDEARDELMRRKFYSSAIQGTARVASGEEGNGLTANRAAHPFRSVETERAMLGRTSAAHPDYERRRRFRYAVAGIDRKGNDWSLGTYADLREAIRKASSQRTYPRAAVLDVETGDLVFDASPPRMAANSLMVDVESLPVGDTTLREIYDEWIYITTYRDPDKQPEWLDLDDDDEYIGDRAAMRLLAYHHGFEMRLPKAAERRVIESLTEQSEGIEQEEAMHKAYHLAMGGAEPVISMFHRLP